jgi:hypothetical protein
MINRLRTILARFVVNHLSGPPDLLRAAWGWLVGEDGLDHKRRCLEEILRLEPDNKEAAMALLWVKQQQQQAADDLHPANVEALADFARETGAEVLRGPLRYPSESGGWQLGDVDLSQHLGKYRGRDVTVIIASVGETEKEKVTCGICGFVLNEAGECPRCKLIAQEMARDIETQRGEMEEALFREVDEILEEGWKDSTENG